MEYKYKEKIIKDVKTASKFALIAGTMLNNISKEIINENPSSESGEWISQTSKMLKIAGTKAKSDLDRFKSEHHVVGCQLNLFDL